MTVKKRIYPRGGISVANVSPDYYRVFLIGGCQDRFSDYRRLVEQATGDFPNWLEEADFTCGKIKNSGEMDGFICVAFTVYVSNRHPREQFLARARAGNYDIREGKIEFNW